MSALDPTGAYCMAAGHASHGCPGSGPLHRELYSLGFGPSRIEPPSEQEIRSETFRDRALFLDEFHGRRKPGDW